MNWTGPYVGGIVLDIGHSTIRAGYSGDQYPSQLWPSAVGIGEDYVVFPVIPSSRYKIKSVEHVKYFEKEQNLSVINREAYIRSVRGTLSGRIHDKVVIEHLKHAKNQPEFEDVSLMLGAHKYDNDCWDDFNNYMISAINLDKITNPNKLTPSNVINSMQTFNSVTPGLSELVGSRPVFIVESNEPNKKNRMTQTEIMFEEIGVPGLHFGHGGQLASYSIGLFTSMVIDMGSSTTSITFLSEDEVTGFKEYNIGGDHIDAILLTLLNRSSKENFSYMMNHPEYNMGVLSLLANEGRDSYAIADRNYRKEMDLDVFNVYHDIRTLKESVLRVSPYPLVIAQELNIPTKLPDGESLDLSEEGSKLRLFNKMKGNGPEIPLDAKTITNLEMINPFQMVGLSCEVLFNPQITYVPKFVDLGSFRGIVPMCEEIIKVNTMYRRDAFTQVALVGGLSSASGIQERLFSEMARAAVKTPQESPLSGTKFKFVNFTNKLSSKHASWIGASIISSLGSFHNCWISRSEYNDHGPNISNRKGGIIEINQ